MRKYYLLSVMVVLLFTSCAKMAGYKNDYHTYNQSEIKNIVKNKTVKYMNEEIYFAKNGQYFSLNSANNAQYDQGRWYTKDKNIKTYDGSWFKLSYLCMQSSIYQYDVCRSVFKNGGKIYFDRFDRPDLKISQGRTALKKRLLSGNYDDATLAAYEKVFGQDVDISRRKQQTRYASKKSSKSEISAGEVAALAIVGAGLSYMFSGNSEGSSSSSSDGSMQLCIPSVPSSQNTSECSAKTASGRYATVKLRNDLIKNCFTLSVYGGNGYGGGSTCSGANEGWGVTANGSSGHVNGLGSAVAWILHRL